MELCPGMSCVKHWDSKIFAKAVIKNFDAEIMKS